MKYKCGRNHEGGSLLKTALCFVLQNLLTLYHGIGFIFLIRSKMMDRGNRVSKNCKEVLKR